MTKDMNELNNKLEEILEPIHGGCSIVAGKVLDDCEAHVIKNLKSLVTEQVRLGLEEFRVFCYEKHAFEAWDTPQSNRQGWLDTKLREFAQLKDTTLLEGEK